MAVSQNLPELVDAALDSAKSAQERISEIRHLAEGQDLSDAQSKELTSEAMAIESTAVDIFTVFEARMQGHFKRGPLARKVEAALLSAGQTDLADRLHQYYLAINVLKHGTGASYRELVNNGSTLIVVKQAAGAKFNSEEVSTGLIDVTAPHFFEELAKTILEAYEFLESR